MKANVTSEETNIINYYQKLNITKVKEIVFNLPKENSLRTLLKYQKNNITDLKYPRKYSDILKRDI